MYQFVPGFIAFLPLIRYTFYAGEAAAFFVAGLVTIGVTTFESVAVATFMGLLSRRTSACVLYGYVGSMAALTAPYLVNGAIGFFSRFNVPQEVFIPGWHLSPLMAYAFELSPHRAWRGQSVAIWALCMMAQVAFSFLVLRAAVRIVTHRHLQDR